MQFPRSSIRIDTTVPAIWISFFRTVFVFSMFFFSLSDFEPQNKVLTISIVKCPKILGRNISVSAHEWISKIQFSNITYSICFKMQYIVI